MSHLPSNPSPESSLPEDFDSLALLVRQTVARRLRKSADEIGLDASFEALGIDSLDLAELFFLLEECLGTRMKMELGRKLTTVRDVVTAVLEGQHY